MRSTTARSSTWPGPGAIQAPGIIPSMFLGRAAAEGSDQAEPHEGEGGACGVRRRRPDDHARVPERPDDQRRPVRVARADGSRRTCRRPASTSSSPAPRSARGCRSTATGRWRSGFRSGARTTRIRPTTWRSRRVELVGLRAGWPKGSDPAVERLAAKARVTTATAARQTLYRQIQRRLNAAGPFFPLIQPTQVFVSTKDLKNAVFNAQYQVDVTQVSPR